MTSFRSIHSPSRARVATARRTDDSARVMLWLLGLSLVSLTTAILLTSGG